jgi:broad specificity phosphatase PhoE
LTIKLVRHGESLANTGELLPHLAGDARVGLSALGRSQALNAGKAIGADFLADSTLYVSPYQRTRETALLLLEGAGTKSRNVYEDPRLREVERGYADEASQLELRKTHGWFYYRHSGGESPADCYDRTSAFLESIMRAVERNGTKKIVIVTHGMTIRCFVMRYLHLSLEQFKSMRNLKNCAVVTIAPLKQGATAVFRSTRLVADGMHLRPLATYFFTSASS